MTERKRIQTARSKAGSKAGPNGHALEKAKAYKAVFAGEAGEIVLADLANLSGMFRPAGYDAFATGEAPGTDFPMRAAMAASRAQMVRHILNMLDLGDDHMIALERAAREERGG